MFRDACHYVGLERSPQGFTCLSTDATRYLTIEETLIALTDRIRHLTSSKQYRRAAVNRRFQARDQQSMITQAVDRVLDSVPSTIVVRVDLHYLSAFQYRQRVEDVFADLDRLRREIECNEIFDDLMWHICSVEQRDERGYHIHTEFFFDGAKVDCDVHKARQVGRLWREITHRQAYYFNCNANKERYEGDLGIGLIDRNDAGIRSKVHKAMHYLAKDEDS